MIDMSTHLVAGLVSTSVARLTMAVAEDLVDLFLDRDGLVVVTNDVVATEGSELEHLLCPEAELSCSVAGILGVL
jgi:hypothetical protein